MGPPLPLFLLLLFGVAAAPPKRHNVILMMADQMRFDMLRAGGNNASITPNLDAMVSQGVWFKHGYSSLPTCTPARASLLTGQSPWFQGMIGYGSVAPRYPFEMPRAMAEAGYATTTFGKDHFGWNASVNEGISHGYETLQLYDGLGTGLPGGEEFDNYDAWFQKVMPGKDPMATGLDWNTWHGAPYVYPEYYHPTAWVGRKAVNFLQNYTEKVASGDEDRPFFLKVSWHRPHSPYDPPARLLNSTTEDMLPPMRLSASGGWDQRFRGLEGDPSGCGPTVDAWCGLMPTANATLGRRAYTASTRFVDEWVGNVLQALDDTGLANNTYVMFIADHGDGQGDHYHWRKGFPYEFSSHVPFALRWPTTVTTRVARGSVLEPVVELRDVFPTALDIAGGTVPPDVLPRNGSSLLCLLQDPTGKSCNWRPYLDLEHSTCYNESNHWNALTDGRMKYIFRAFFAEEQLFNLTADPYELVDLSANPAYGDELAKWRQRLVTQFVNEHRGPVWVQNGTLMKRTEGQTYSPYFPKAVPVVGSSMMLAAQSGADDAGQLWTVNTTIDCDAGCQLSLVDYPTLCGTILADTTLQLDTCSPSSPLFTKQVAAPTTDGNTFRLAAGDKCLTSAGANAKLTMEACGGKNQVWIVGESGRIWQGNLLVASTVAYPGMEDRLVLPPPLVRIPQP